MSNTRLSILFASATVTSLAVLLLFSHNAAAGVNISDGQGGAPATNTAPAAGGIPNGIPAEQAKQHIGETNTVCGLVASTRYMDSAKTKPTLLNFDRPFPDHTFSVMIADANRAKFKGPPEVMFKGKTLCVTGLIIDFRGKPEIVVDDPSQISVTPESQAAGTNTVQKTPAPAKAP
jgi:DNA/RNA endonuclease YhcR with UshA esterase domain